MMRRLLFVLVMLGAAIILSSTAQAVIVTLDEDSTFDFDKDEDIEIKIWVEKEKEDERGNYTVTIKDRPDCKIKDNSSVTKLLHNTGDKKSYTFTVEQDEDIDDGKLVFEYEVSNETGGIVETGEYEVEIGEGGSDGGPCGAVFFMIPLVGLLALVAFVKRE